MERWLDLVGTEIVKFGEMDDDKLRWRVVLLINDPESRIRRRTLETLSKK